MFTFQKENLHHAYLIPEDGAVLPILLDYLETLSIPTRGNPDFFLKESETFSIEDAREVKAFQIEASVSGGKKIIVLLTKYFSHPAQHALLKVFEEPAKDVHFFVITKEISVLLSTLKSRCITLDVTSSISDETIIKRAKDFLKGEKEDRLSLVGIIIKEFDKEETSIPLKSYAVQFLDQLELGISKENNKHPYNTEVLWKVKDYIHDQGSSVKNLLETLALTLNV